MNKWVSRLTTLCTLAAMMVLPSPAVRSGLAYAQNKPVTTDARIPIERKVSTSCVEKEVQLTGEIQAQFRVKADGSGGSSLEADFSFEGVTGTILSSGNKYEAAGTSHFDYSGSTPHEFTFVSNFALNKPKSDESLMGHAKLRIGINRKGEVTAVVLEVDIDCNT